MTAIELTDGELGAQLSRRSHVGLRELDRERLVAEITARATDRPRFALLPRRGEAAAVAASTR